MKKCLFILVILAICVSGIVLAANKRVEPAQPKYNYVGDQSETLTGLKGVGVLVEDLTTVEKEAGLTKSQIQTDVELKLRLAGIKVLSKEERIKIFGGAYLYVTINSIKLSPSTNIAFNIYVSLRQDALLLKDWNTICPAGTWEQHAIGVAPRSYFVGDARKGLKDAVDKFINDYLAANPKE